MDREQTIAHLVLLGWEPACSLEPVSLLPYWCGVLGKTQLLWMESGNNAKAVRTTDRSIAEYTHYLSGWGHHTDYQLAEIAWYIKTEGLVC